MINTDHSDKLIKNRTYIYPPVVYTLVYRHITGSGGIPGVYGGGIPGGIPFNLSIRTICIPVYHCMYRLSGRPKRKSRKKVGLEVLQK